MTDEELIATYPRLWHMAEDGSWPSIQQQGLMSAEALVDTYAIGEPRRAEILSSRRPQSVPLTRDGLPQAIVRDQKPMSDAALAKCLGGGLQPADWYRLLNSYSFFWLSRDRIWSLLRARAYRNKPQSVLTVDTASLVAAHSQNIRLSPMNSGSTLYRPIERDAGIFSPIGAFPYSQRAKTRKPSANVVELVVPYAVPDIVDHVLAVHQVENDNILAEIWRSVRATDEDRP
jgi:hypothetical protein